VVFSSCSVGMCLDVDRVFCRWPGREMTRAAPTRLCRLRRMRLIERTTSPSEPRVDSPVRLPGRNDQRCMMIHGAQEHANGG
jgi:hypothetical protein